MAWMIWFLSNNPTYQQRLLEEVERETGGECGEKMKEYAFRNDTYDHLIA